MGDGVTKRVAVIINGDTEARHLTNVDLAIARFRNDGFDEVQVLSTKRPREIATRYLDIQQDSQAFNQVLTGLQNSLDDDDVLSVYITGHGDLRQDGACLVTPNHCHSLADFATKLNALPYGYRTLFMDQCFSGQEAHRFVKPRTTLLAIGSPGETVSCSLFTPQFFSDTIPDVDHDGLFSLQERCEYAARNYTASSILFFSSEGLPRDLAGHAARTAPFKAQLTKVSDRQALQGILRTLRPGQLALVNFSADWCAPCTRYAPEFEKLAGQYGGQFLMIEAKGVNGSDRDWAHYGITALPTVAFMDWQGNVFPVEDRSDPKASLYKTILTPEAYAPLLEAKYFATPDEYEKQGLLAKLVAQGATGLANLERIGHAVFSGAAHSLQVAYLEALTGARAGSDAEALGALFWRLVEKYPQTVCDAFENCAGFSCRAVGHVKEGLARESRDAMADNPHVAPAVRTIAILWRHGSPDGDRKNFALLQRDPDPEIRRAAAEALTLLRNQLAPYIERAIPIALKDPDPDVRARLTRGLAVCIPTPALYQFLLRQLRSPWTSERIIAADALEFHSENSGALFSALTAYKQIQGPYAKVVLARMLLKMARGDKAGIVPPALRRELAAYIRAQVRHADAEVRQQAATGLDNVVTAVDADRHYLVGLITSERDPQVKAALLEVLSTLQDNSLSPGNRNPVSLPLHAEITQVILANLSSNDSALIEAALYVATSLADPIPALVKAVTRGFYQAIDSGYDQRAPGYLAFFAAHPKHFTAQMAVDLKLLDSQHFAVVVQTLLILEKSPAAAALRSRLEGLAQEKYLDPELKKIVDRILRQLP